MRRIAGFVLLCLISCAFNTGDPVADVAGKYVTAPAGMSTLVLKRNGKFRSTQHLIHNHTSRGHWTMSGDTVVLSYEKPDGGTEKLLRQTDGRLAGTDGTGVSYQRKR